MNSHRSKRGVLEEEAVADFLQMTIVIDGVHRGRTSIFVEKKINSM
jgi:hypothetical protein